MATKTINLTGAEVAVTGLDGAHAHIRNDGTDVIYAAKAAGISAGADGVLGIPAGQAETVYGISGTVYMLGTGSAQIISNDYSELPFKTSATSGGSGADEVARAAINAHSGNEEIHVTAEEKAAWNGKAELSDIPDTLPANGGNSDTVDGKHADDFLLKTGGIMNGTLNISDKRLWFGVDGSVQFYIKWENGLLGLYNHDGIQLAYATYGGVYGGNAASVGAYTEDKIAALEARIAALEGGTT